MQIDDTPYPADAARFACRPNGPRRSSVGDYWHFLKAFVLRPATVGAVAPSSGGLAEAMIPPSAMDSASVVVELGAGTGAVTRTIRGRMNPGATLILLEVDPAAARRLRDRFPRTQVICDEAERLPDHLRRLGHAHVDCVVSCIPWRSMSNDSRRRTLAAVAASLRRGGAFSAMAYLHASAYPSARRFAAELRRHFGSVASSRVVWANLPPAFVYYARRPADGLAG